MFCTKFPDENQNEYTFKWKIENASFYSIKDEGLISPIFTPEYFYGSKWYLKFYTSFQEAKFACFLCRNNEDLGPKEISVYFKIDVGDSKGNIIASNGNYERCDDYKFEKGHCASSLLVSASFEEIAREEDMLISCNMCTAEKHSRSIALTRIGIDRISFVWGIKLFDCIGGNFQRRRFSLSETLQYEITITALNDNLEIKIEDVTNAAPILVRGKITLLNNEMCNSISHTDHHLFNAVDGFIEWKFHSFISLKLLFQNGWLRDATFRLLCQFSVANGKYSSNSVSQQSNFLSKLNTISTLSDDFGNLLKNMNNSDVKLQTENGILSAHKIILSARSPVFDSMFNKDMFKNQLNVVQIPDIDMDTAKLFLKFIYTGSLNDLDYKTTLKLLLVADKYQVLTLKEVCSEFLISVLSVGSVCEILSVAHMMDFTLLKRAALDFVLAHIDKIWNSSMWLEYIEKNNSLFSEIFSHISTKRN